MNSHTDALRSRIRAIPVAPPPPPWTAIRSIAVGGLTNLGVGTSDGAELVLTISHAGRGLFDDHGVLLARNNDEPDNAWLDETQLEAIGIDRLAQQRVRVAGLAGGGLPASTRDGWHVSSLPIDWPHDLVILEPPGCGALWPGHEAGCVAVFAEDASELRAFGFSPSGRVLILASSAEVRLYIRELPGSSM